MSLFNRFTLSPCDLAIDLGTANTVVYVKDEGVVLAEPSVVAIQTENGIDRVLSVGADAKLMLGKTPENIKAIRPLRNGVISDLEVEYEEEPGHLWYVRYPVVDDHGNDTDDAIMIATTRPETIPADVAIAVHPDDEQWKRLHGKKVRVPLGGRVIPVIVDDAIALGFGTGGLKVTPGHDVLDFEIGERHGLEVISVIDLAGNMTPEAGPGLAGLDRDEAKRVAVAELQDRGFLVKTEERPHNVGHCQRCRTVVEPLVSKQWFVRIKPLAEPAIAAVREGRTRFFPEHWSKTYFGWMENIPDGNVIARRGA